MISFAMGLLGGTWHLLLTALRVRWLHRGGVALALLGLPLAWAGPVAGFFGAIQLEPGVVWPVIPGLLLARVGLLAPLARWVGGRP